MKNLLLFLLSLLLLSCMKLSGLRDHDDDGIRTRDDACPNQTEDFDGYKDEDGCPESDNDNDGIADSLDTCPNDREDLDGFEDTDGCPEWDNDNDGIHDFTDKCPNKAEDFDGFEDQDGCPEEDDDTDYDRIPDANDKCPNEKEDRDNFEDDDGCPDLDNDKDGIPDNIDKCPNEPEVVNGYKDEDGCPDKKSNRKKKHPGNCSGHPMPSINFHSGATKLLPEGEKYLLEIVQTLQEWPEITINITGHTDSKEKRYKELSLKRAKVAKKFLIDNGINEKRITVEGMGRMSPRASNKTAAGRAENRRVEIDRTDK